MANLLAQFDWKSLFASKLCLGVDIGTFSLKTLEAKKGQLPLQLNNCLNSPQAEANEAFRQELFKKSKLTKRPAAFALSDEKVEIHEFQLPLLKGKELTTAIDWEIRRAISAPEFAYHDFSVTSTATGYEVICAVAAKEVVQARYDEGNSLTVTPKFLEPESQALLATAKLIHGAKDLDRIAIVDLGHSAFRLTFIHAGKVSFVRSLYPGLQTVSDTLFENGPKTVPELLALYKKVRMPADGVEADTDPLVGYAERLLQESLYTLCEEIHRSEFFAKDQKNLSEIEKVLLCGGGACIPYAFEYLSHHLTEKKVEILNPFQHARGLPEGMEVENGPAFACALGLSVRDIL